MATRSPYWDATQLFLQIVDLIFHPVTFPLNEYRFGVMQEPVKQCRRERAIVIEYLSPVLWHAIRRDDCGTAFIACTDDLKEAVSAEFIDWKISKFVDHQD